MAKILLTNDDGVHAAGIKALRDSIPDNHEIVVVAPDAERSATSHSISLGKKLKVKERRGAEGIHEYALNGTPADCVKWALHNLDQSEYPDLIVSGINHGANTGVSVFYSGTLSAAREGFINRIPSFAVSLCDRHFQDFTSAQAITHKLVDAYLNEEIKPDVMLNVNVPPLTMEEVAGVKITKQADSRFVQEFIKKVEGGTKVYELAGHIEVYDSDGSSDEEAIKDGYISVTPLKLDMTDYDSFQNLNHWLKNSKGS